MSYDPEAIYQDADFEQMEAERVGRNMSHALKTRKVECFHDGCGPVGDHKSPAYDGRVQCHDCGVIFTSSDAWWAEHMRLVDMYT